jgi:hypothetical protein
MWFTIQLILLVLGLLLAFVGNRFSIPILFNAGVGFLGLVMMAFGWEGIITRQITLGRRRYGGRRTYTGMAAIFHGIQLNFLGLFIIGVALMMHFGGGRGIFLQLVRRPGLPLVLFGGLCLLQAMIAFLGAQQERQGSGCLAILSLLAAGVLPGLILTAVGLVLSALGVFETLAPARFDELGGGLLEELYGAR